MKLIAVEVSTELRNSRVPISPQSYAKCQNESSSFSVRCLASSTRVVIVVVIVVIVIK